MRTRVSFTALVFAVSFVLAAQFAPAQGLNNNEVEFTGTISSVVVNGEGNGTLFVHLDTFVQRVLVNSSTVLKDAGGEPITLEFLAAQIDKDVEVTGKFSSSGILATQVRLLETPASDTFTLRGHITQVSASGPQTIISLLGMSILADSSTVIQADGATASLSDLKPGTKIQAEGTISTAGIWKATTINILTGVLKRGNLRFEGVVQSYVAGLLKVAVNGPPGNVTDVHVTSQTVVSGTITAGVYVLVVGVLESDLSVTATEVRVLSALEIKPDERKLQVGNTATFTVKLREIAAADVTVLLSVDPPSGIVSLSTTSLPVLKGAQTAEFTVTALAIGTATVKAAALGSEATALVKVGAISEDEQEPAQGEVRIAFAPDHIKLEPNGTREVVLLVSPPQTNPLNVTLQPGSALVTIASTSPLGQGSSLMKVTIQAGPGTGTASVVATLPAALGGGQAELVVEVEAKGGGKK